MKSILQDRKECWVCGRSDTLHSHHVYGGANRKISEKEGCKVWLCPEHHNMSDQGVHFNKKLDISLKKACQQEWEEKNDAGEDEFREKFGRSYL